MQGTARHDPIVAKCRAGYRLHCNMQRTASVPAHTPNKPTSLFDQGMAPKPRGCHALFTACCTHRAACAAIGLVRIAVMAASSALCSCPLNHACRYADLSSAIRLYNYCIFRAFLHVPSPDAPLPKLPLSAARTPAPRGNHNPFQPLVAHLARRSGFSIRPHLFARQAVQAHPLPFTTHMPQAIIKDRQMALILACRQTRSLRAQWRVA